MFVTQEIKLVFTRLFNMTLKDLYKIIEDRKRLNPDSSYVASLFRAGKSRIIQKVGEEAIEVVLAAKGKSKKRLISEIADLWFHSLVLLASFNISLSDLELELDKRNKG